MHRREARSDPQYQAREQQINNARRQHARSSRHSSLRALSYQPHNFYNTTSIGTMSLLCSNCGAFEFEKETDSLCCSKGNVKLDEFPQVQAFLLHLYEGIDSNGKHFLANIHKYNSVFQMTTVPLRYNVAHARHFSSSHECESSACRADLLFYITSS